MTMAMKQMCIDLTYQDPTVRIPQAGDTQFLVAMAITRDFFGSRTALALGAGWLGLILAHWLDDDDRTPVTVVIRQARLTSHLTHSDIGI